MRTGIEIQRYAMLRTRHVLGQGLRWGVEVLRATLAGGWGGGRREENCKVRIKTLEVSLVIGNLNNYLMKISLSQSVTKKDGHAAWLICTRGVQYQTQTDRIITAVLTIHLTALIVLFICRC